MVVSGNQAEVTGVLKVQVHYYEDGNVQLVTSKEVKEAIPMTVRRGEIYKSVLEYRTVLFFAAV